MRILTVYSLIFCLHLAAQQPNAPNPKFLPEDPELYFSFFQFHNDLDQQVQSANPVLASQLTGNAIVAYNVSTEDFTKLTLQVRAFAKDFRNWQFPVQAYFGKIQANKQLPDVNVVKAFQFQRQSLVKSHYDAIHQALSPASWNGLHTYINGNFKQGGRP